MQFVDLAVKNADAIKIMINFADPIKLKMNILESKQNDAQQALAEANEKLKMSEDRFQILFGLGNEGIVIISAEGKPSYISPSIKKVMGYTDCELQQLSLGSLVHPDDIAAITAIQELAINNPGISYEYPISRRKHKDGSWKWVEATITNLLNEPSIKGIVTNFRDVTERKLAQDKVLEHAHKYQILIEQSADGIAIIDANANAIYLSPAIEKMLGFNKAEIADQGIISFVHPEDLQAVYDHLAEVMANPGRSISPLTVRMRHIDGGWRWLEGTMTNMLHDPVIGGIVDNFRDVTLKKEAQDRMLYSNRLYNFISQINQTIVHVSDEQTLFDAACKIAIEFGKFEFAWIGVAETGIRKIKMRSSAGTTKDDLDYFSDYTYQEGGPINTVLDGGDYYVVSEIEKRQNHQFNAYAAKRGFKSAIFIAIKKQGKAIGTFNLYSSEKNFFNDQEIALLKEASADISFALDVFEKDIRRTAAEKALQHKELRLSQAQAIGHLGSWEMDLATGVSLWSEEALRIHGLPEDQHVQSYEIWRSFIHPDDVAHVLQQTKEALENHSDAGFYHRILRRDGSVRYVYSQSQTEYDADGKPIVINGVVHDVTDLKLAEATALKVAEEKIDILESIRDAFFAVDSDWIVTYWNKEAERFTKTPKEKIIGKQLWDVFKESFGSLSYKKYHTAISAGEVLHFQDYFESFERWFDISAYPSGHGLSVYFKDITTKKYAEAERIKMVEDMVQRNKDLEQFSYIVSHNLRAPVANMKGLAEELNNGIYPPEIIAMLKRELSASINRLDEVIIDLNSILQIKKEVIENKEWVDLPGLIDSIRLGIINLIDSENVHIDTDFHAATSIMTVKSYLYSIFYNLISNSIKYRHPDHTPQITIKSRATSGGTVIEFSDNGVGINLEQKKDQVFRLYKRFHQHVEGKGIGLFMVKTQVEMLGGTITIESAVNKGTTFRIEFPDAIQNSGTI